MCLSYSILNAILSDRVMNNSDDRSRSSNEGKDWWMEQSTENAENLKGSSMTARSEAQSAIPSLRERVAEMLAEIRTTQGKS